MKNLRQIRALVISPALLARTLCTCPTFSLKNVTKSNFASTLGDLRRHISSADFVAVDLEMTGVTSAPWRESFEFDRYDVRYLKVKDSAEKFAVVQFGVCPFRWDPHKHSFVAHPHNFYIFPRQELPADGPSYEFLCQTTSIDFLARYQFDFNACIREGLSYLSRRQEDEALSRLKSAYDAMLIDSCPTTKEVKDIPLASMADILFSERMKIRFHEWRGGLLQERNEVSHFNGSLTDSEQQFETIFFKMRPALTLKGFTSHQLRLIQEVIRKHFKDLTYVRAYDENSILQKLIVFVDSEDDKIELMREVKNGLHKEAEKKIKAAVGFRQVIDIISEEKKLIVGHNCFLDLAHIYSKFFGPLPPTAEEFACHTHKFFPHVIDTKILLNADKVLQQLMKKTSTSLSSAFTLLCPEIASSKTSNSVCQPRVDVEVQVDDMRSSNWNSGAKHEAGYDAFMTGCVFAQACRHLGIDFESASPNENLAHNEKLQKYVNLVYLSWNSGDVINLSNGNVGAEFLNLNAYMKRFAKISYPNIVLIWGFPSKLKAIDIKECLCKVFGVSSVTSIYHLDETTVFVQFSKAELASDFLVLKERLESSNDPISVLHPFSKLFEGVNTHAAGYEIYKEICGSPISEVSFSEQAEAVGIKWKTRLLDSTRALEAKRHGQSGTEIERVSYGSKDTEKSEKIKRLILKTTTNQHGNACGLGDLLYGASDPPREEMMATNL
ncbi:hypothetical protein Nepgr_007667 [Nepenthes gracilis]|uniref:Uncharacterized protein n=1 Tax=Nepenthes gracilis TaxID=150966 RepID=A0AAD3S799_NEPGR|nr:hypothetical protein Nepgr_007667 [Nepenthes gracilis]